MKKLLFTITLFFAVASLNARDKFFSVQGKEIVDPNGKPFLIKGTNLGNWLVPEGYMFKFKRTNSPYMIHDMLGQLIGPTEAAKFWDTFLENYITHDDIRSLKKMGVNSIRVPFNYKLFTVEDYMGRNDASRGFKLLDRVISWCKAEGVYVILDMHCAPGGQTGDNIDDGYGYPFLFESKEDQKLAIDIWRSIAKRYAKESIIIGYDLLNEPVAHYFDSKTLNPLIVPLYKEMTAAIRSVDKNHIIFYGGSQWNTNFNIFSELLDKNAVYTFHKYGDKPDFGSIKRFIEFRDKFNAPIYIGETGENTDEWVREFRELLEKHNIGWHFWPYKKLDSPKNISSVQLPDNYQILIDYAEANRGSYKEIRELKVDRAAIKKILKQYLENIKYKNCEPNQGYIKALGLNLD
ncbi:glycoside hydrolase family 5 [Pseudopedobacter saltans DSM 12145]|uniref:Glycoside hydrolase family 5 n=1 Tax=Pseudopedobacter saltans (strain ATCC 51119 / DSM 12145 / JCM 21818 / CCUG 39354 / LMG 10337 / NBRC 100064 / NCIMB 13643) TaxID=762903 RepID=F0S666_PSESL|nr:cellulase family glycosylhydrolase [Pseudopedobacter saltans]ADY53180.1 glycoside hydrolase family 5 [Pseudopedobacter saltans DSM 12145]